MAESSAVDNTAVDRTFNQSAAHPGAADPGALSYEQARDELVQVVNRLEQGGATLEESLQLWERGEALAARCEEWLIGARKRLEDARAGSESQANAGASSKGDNAKTPGGAN